MTAKTTFFCNLCGDYTYKGVTMVKHSLFPGLEDVPHAKHVCDPCIERIESSRVLVLKPKGVVQETG